MNERTNTYRAHLLQHITKSLIRKLRRTDVTYERPQREYRSEQKVFSTKSAAKLLAIFKEACKKIHTEVIETTSGQLKDVLTSQLEVHGEGSVVIPEDERFWQYGLSSITEEDIVHTWDTSMG